MDIELFDYKNYGTSERIRIETLERNLKIEKAVPSIYGDNKYESLIQGNASFLRSAKDGLPIQFCQDTIGAVFNKFNNLETAVICDGVSSTVAPAQTSSLLTKLFLHLYLTKQDSPELKPFDFYKKINRNLKLFFLEEKLIEAIKNDASLNEVDKDYKISEVCEGHSGSSTLLAGIFIEEKAYFHSYGDGTILLVNEEGVMWFDRKLSGHIPYNCPDQFSLIQDFDVKKLWVREETLPKNKPTMILMATDGFEENKPIYEVIAGLKDFINKLQPKEVISEILSKTAYSDDISMVCVRIVP